MQLQEIADLSDCLSADLLLGCSVAPEGKRMPRRNELQDKVDQIEEQLRMAMGEYPDKIAGAITTLGYRRNLPWPPNLIH